MMKNHPQYRDMKLTDEVTFTLKAVDACMFMAWAMQDAINTEPVDHIFVNCFGPQFEEQMFIPASIKAARAEHAERQEQALKEASEQILRVFGQNVNIANGITVVCDECGARGHYDELPFGILACGHNGPRHGILGEGE